MGLLNLLKKKAVKEQPPAEGTAEAQPDDSLYSGMRVEVTALDSRVLFAAKLMGLQGSSAELHQYTEADIAEGVEAIRVRIRGYNDHNRKAVYMEGVISPQPRHIWQVEELAVVRVGNDRAFFRLSTNIDATMTILGGAQAGDKPCKLLNISVGGACIGTTHQCRDGDKFLLKVKLLEDRDLSVMFCQVLRVIEKEDGKFEYGCKFLELNEADQNRITQNIFAVQRRERGVTS